ncbi:MAG: hypothetical protein IJR01_03025 [Bacteroidales bacterium]|nr:hypothetical protein [Bacteroidales bacterium]
MKKILTVLAAGLLASAYAYSQDAAGVAMEFAARPTDPVSYAQGGTTAFYSAAVRLEDEKPGVTASLMFAPFKTKATKATDMGANVFLKTGRLAFGVSGFRETGESMDIINAQGQLDGTFKPSNTALGASVAFNMNHLLNIGLSVRYLENKLTSSAKLNTISIDLMAAGGKAGFQYAAGITNLGGKVKADDGSKYSIPSAATVAGKYAYESGKHGIEGKLQGDYFFKGGIRMGIGTQYSYDKKFFARAGYCYGGDTVLPKYFSLGAGVKLGGFSLDVAALFGDLSGTFIAGLTYKF